MLLPMVKAVIPGTFDPPTNGHLDLIERASRMFEELFIVVAVNSEKKGLFSPHERRKMLEGLTRPLGNVKVVVWDHLIVDYARQEGASVLLRGIRALSDFSYEFELAMIYRELAPELEVVFMPTDPKYLVVRSSVVKELAGLGGKVDDMVPSLVLKELKKRIGGG